MKSFALAVAALLVVGCSSIGQEVASGINNSQLKNTLGKQYSEVMYERPDFGKLVGRETLPNGDQVMKHVGEFGQATSNVGGIYGKQHQQARVIYFRVDRKGVVRDWATDPDRWLRRTVVICQLGAKERTDLDILEKAIDANLDDPDFFLRKAIGWALRQHARSDPDWVRAFVASRGDHMSALSRREALKHLAAL